MANGNFSVADELLSLLELRTKEQDERDEAAGEVLSGMLPEKAQPGRIPPGEISKLVTDPAGSVPESLRRLGIGGRLQTIDPKMLGEVQDFYRRLLGAEQELVKAVNEDMQPLKQLRGPAKWLLGLQFALSPGLRGAVKAKMRRTRMAQLSDIRQQIVSLTPQALKMSGDPELRAALTERAKALGKLQGQAEGLHRVVDELDVPDDMKRRIKVAALADVPLKELKESADPSKALMERERQWGKIMGNAKHIPLERVDAFIADYQGRVPWWTAMHSAALRSTAEDGERKRKAETAEDEADLARNLDKRVLDAFEFELDLILDEKDYYDVMDPATGKAWTDPKTGLPKQVFQHVTTDRNQAKIMAYQVLVEQYGFAPEVIERALGSIDLPGDPGDTDDSAAAFDYKKLRTKLEEEAAAAAAGR